MQDQHLPPSLVYSTDTAPGIRRHRRGRGFSYSDSSGHSIRDKQVLQRIHSLVIPPAWKQVWICAQPNGHLQATGRDEKRRKQYRYHPEWQAFSTKTKYAHLLEFADQLPALRRRIASDLRRRHWDREKVLALAVALLDELYLRVGNQQYTRRNHTYGLTTLRRKHLQVTKGVAHLHFTGKKGTERQVALRERRLARLLRECSELPGYELLRYREGSSYHSIDSADVNAYINEHLHMRVHISAKDFRTWGGTVTCARLAPSAAWLVAEQPRRKQETTLVRLVARDLGNTVSVCRKYYIHPAVLQYCCAHPQATPSAAARKKYPEFAPHEQLVLAILNEEV